MVDFLLRFNTRGLYPDHQPALQSWGFGTQPAGQGCIQTTKL